jgi:AAA domain (dynein-related subfamily)
MQSIILKLTNIEQYDDVNKTILWQDTTKLRWQNLYPRLNMGDRGFFLAKGKLYTGTLQDSNANTSILFSAIEIYEISTDDFLSINAINPELNSRTKAMFHPFITSSPIDYEAFKNEFKANRFVHFWLVKADNLQSEISKFSNNDRIITIGNDLIFKDFFIYENNSFNAFLVNNELFNVKGKSIYDAIDIFNAISTKKEKTRSNNVALLTKIQNHLKDNAYFEFTSFSSYFNIIHNKLAYLYSNIQSKQYYVGGSFWEDINPKDQTSRFINDGIWENGYDDKFTDIVINIPVGSLIAIKSTIKIHNQMEIKAIGEVIANPKDGKILGVEWLEDFESFIVDFSGGYWDTIKRVSRPNDIKQIFFHTDEEVTANINTEINKEMLQYNINTILYGPPGTGKTFELNKIKREFFTDETKSIASTDILKEKMKEFAYWEIITAILFTNPNPMSVRAICDTALYKAKFNPTNKVKPQNMAWVDLQAYAIDASTNSSPKYRRAHKIFEKNGNSEWTIAKDKRIEIPNIIDDELIEIAKNPMAIQDSKIKLDERFSIITFHQKYSYEDFIEGIKPVTINEDFEEEGTELKFKLEKGIFFKACLKAIELAGYNTFEECKEDGFENRKAKFDAIKNNNAKQYAILIDEINRANISAVFGELISLIEDTKRIGAEDELWLTLPYSGDKFCVPPNLFIIGTMNTADKSIALLDIALRRRFEFISLYPKYELDTLLQSWASVLLQKLNENIYVQKNKNPDFFIGHSFFINKTESEKSKIFNNKVIPLLMEYFQNNAEKVIKVLTDTGISLIQTSIKENYQIIAE